MKPDNSIYSLNIPILGICYGHQLICKHLGGNVITSKKREFGKAFIKIKSKSKIFEGIYKKNNQYQVWMSYGDKVNKLPKLFKVIASTSNAKFAAIVNEDKKIYGFDTFEGMVEPKEIDIDYRNIPASEMYSLFKSDGEKSNLARCSLDETNKNIIETVPKNNIKLIKGRVENTLLEEKNLPEKISILRLDTDWYESTKIELEILYPKLMSGGFLIIDDYGHFKGCRKAVDEYFKDNMPYLHYVNYTCRLIIKR